MFLKECNKQYFYDIFIILKEFNNIQEKSNI